MSFSTALSGLNAASADLNVKSNNIANVNTTGFKQSRAEFGDVFAVSAFGTSSKTAIGNGAVLQNVAQQFNQGNLEFTDNALDLAISGEGFFAMAPTLDSGEIIYTRAGEFGINKDGYMVNSEGSYLRTFPVDEDGVISATSMTAAKPLQLPASAGAPEPTTLLTIATNLPSNAEGQSVAAVGFVAGTYTTTSAVSVFDYTSDSVSFNVDGTPVTLNGSYTDADGVASAIQGQLSGYTVTANSSGQLVITSPTATAPSITSYNGNADGDAAIADFTTGGYTNQASGTLAATFTGTTPIALDYSAGDVTFSVTNDLNGTDSITLTGTYANSAALLTAINGQLTTSGTTATIDGSGNLVITSNTATDADTLTVGSFTDTNSVISIADFVSTGTSTTGTTGTTASVKTINPLDPSTYTNSTSATVYDSLGNEHIITTYYQKIDADVAGSDNQWQMVAYISADDIKITSDTTTVTDGATTLVQLGDVTSISFNSDGTLAAVDGDPATAGNQNVEFVFSAAEGTELVSGAADQTVTLSLAESTQNSGAFSVGALTVNGFPTGRLTGVDISEEGLIRATYSNGQAIPIGKIALGNFANVQALNKIGNTSWKETTDSGPVIAGEAGTGSFGQIQSGALETSNVDLTKELVGLITVQRNFQANSKAIETNNAITQTIINLR
jgi:flagellar hook protein FlgE